MARHGKRVGMSAILAFERDAQPRAERGGSDDVKVLPDGTAVLIA